MEFTPKPLTIEMIREAKKSVEEAADKVANCDHKKEFRFPVMGIAAYYVICADCQIGLDIEITKLR